MDLADAEIKKAHEKARGGEGSRALREFKESAGALLPWGRVWASLHLSALSAADLDCSCADALGESRKAEGSGYREKSTTADEIVEMWAEVLCASRSAHDSSWTELKSWVAGLRYPLATPTTTRLIWFAARRVGSPDLALQQAAAKFARLVGERDDAASTAGALVALSRAVIPVSTSEANQLFKTAIEIANRVGDESLTRWTSLLWLAENAADADHPQGELAYRTARAAELIYDYVVRDKHFDWERSVEAVLSLCPNSAVAILSRWRDRRFGRWRRLLPVAVEHLLRSGRLNPWVALSLIGFRADWDCALHLSLILDRLKKQSDKAKATEFYLDNVRLDSHTLEAWLAIRKVAVANGAALDDIDAEIARETKRQAAANHKGAREEPVVAHAAEPEASPDWNRVFGQRKLHDHVDLQEAYSIYRGQSERNNISEFLAQAIERVQPGEEAAIVAALESFTELDLWDYRRVLSSIPEEWLTRISVRPALRSLISRPCRIHLSPTNDVHGILDDGRR